MLCHDASRGLGICVCSTKEQKVTFQNLWQAAPGPWEGGGFTKKQLGALERISEHMEAAGSRNVIEVSE